MTTLTDVVAAVVVHSSAFAFSHFGVHLAPVQVEKAEPVAERVVSRTPRKLNKLSDCPETQHRVRVEKV
jgi:hypothetical protein